MSALIDISVPICARLPSWPDSPPISLRRYQSLAAGGVANASELQVGLHAATHVDAPLHFLSGGAEIDHVGLDPFAGDAVVAEVKACRRIGATELEKIELPPGVSRLLLKTVNSGGWYTREFEPNFAALTLDGAEWVARRGLQLVGIDYLSIQRFEDGPQTHQTLLSAGVSILEGLELVGVPSGRYELLCLPIRLEGAEAAPCRAVLRRMP